LSADKLMLIDGNSLLYRAFYALPLLHTRDGVYTNAVYGFLTMFNRVVDQEQPTHLVVAFDKARESFRNNLFADYKVNRSAAPDELVGQFAIIREVLAGLNVTYMELEGYEADDIIGTLSKMAEDRGMESLIVTGDGDALQLVSDKVTVLMTKKGITEMERYDPVKVAEKWEVSPERMIDIKALMGDASDNIPGVPGVGAKTAIKLVKQYGTLDNLYNNVATVSGAKLKEKLIDNRELAFLSRDLATINRKVEIDFRPEDYVRKEPDRARLLPLYQRLEFNGFANALLATESIPDVVTTLPDIETHYMESAEDVAEFQATVDSQDIISVLVDYDYHHPMWGRLKQILLASKGQVYGLQVSDKSMYRLEWIRPLLESAAVKKCLHNAKLARVILMRYGIQLDGVVDDTMLLAYVKDPSFQGEDLKAAILTFLNKNVAADEPSQLVSNLEELRVKLAGQIDGELMDLYRQVELPLVEILAQMEFCGVKVDRPTLEEISEDLAVRIDKVEKLIYEAAGQEFNINSPKQLGKVLFEDLGLKAIKKTKTGYSTGVEVLEKLYDEHKIIPYIMHYRQLTKLKSTYVDALQALIHPDTGRVHTIFKQALTATGRLSSVEPNLQNIPIKMEEGRRIRKAFTARDDDWLLLSADYSQIDLRSLAHISGDEMLIETFRQGVDIHTLTASQIFKVPLEKVDYDLRRRAKAVNFGIVYGISDFGLARDTGVSRREAAIYIENYLDTYPGVRRYMQEVVEFGKKYGYVETLLKRRRYLPDLKAKNKMVQSFAQRMALNTPIQGTSADIIKLAMIKVYKELKSRQLNSQLLLQVHDELVLEVRRDELEEVALLVRECMENACTLKVPLEVSLETGDNWYDMKEY
jgi:DNA polymerase-1